MAGSEMSIRKCQQRVYKEAYVPPPHKNSLQDIWKSLIENEMPQTETSWLLKQGVKA